MNVVMVTTRAERDEMTRALDGYCLYIEGEITKDEFRRDYPRKVWIDTGECDNYDAALPFTVVDNRDGECFSEDFATLDGAFLYASDVYMTPEGVSGWDYMGAVRDGGDIVRRLEERDDD